MDLTRLYNLTTPELREEAEQLGIPDTYAMGRGQLIQAIRGKDRLSEPEGLLGKVFGFAKWALQAAGETSTGRPAATPESVPVPVAGPASASEPASAPASTSEPVLTSASEPASAPEPIAEAAETSRPPAGVFSKNPGVFEEPFPTLTMARILADQGHYKRSLAIYAKLLNEEPGDHDLGAEAEAVRAQARARRSHPPP